MKKLLTLLLAIAVLFTNCQEKMKEEKFVWGAALSAPKEYPIEVIRGILKSDESFASFGTIYGINNIGWGKAGAGMDNQYLKKLPDTLEFTWHSLVEDIYYTGKWQLDTAYIAKVFRQEYFDRSSLSRKMSSLSIGLGPKGKVVLWATGAACTIELGSYQAHDTIITADGMPERDQHMFTPGRTQRILNGGFYIKEEDMQRIKKEGYPDPQLYSQYQKKYNWELELKWQKPMTNYRIFYTNGEFETRLFTKEENPFFTNNRAIPNRFAISIIDDDKDRGLGIIFQSYNELKKAFEKLSLSNSHLKIEIEMDISNPTAGKVYVSNPYERIQIENVLIKNSFLWLKNKR